MTRSSADDRRVPRLVAVAIAVAVTLVVGSACSEHAATSDRSTTPSRAPEAQRTTTTSVPVPPTAPDAPAPTLSTDQRDVLQGFAGSGSRPDGCREPDDGWRASDPRMAWLLGPHDPDAVDGVVTPDGASLDLQTGGVAGPDGSPRLGVLTSQLVGGPTVVDLDRPLSSVSVDASGGLVGVTTLTSPLQVVRIADDGRTSVVADLPSEVELAGWLSVDEDGPLWVTDLTDVLAPRLLVRRGDTWEVAASGGRADAHLVDPVADSRATPTGGATFTGPGGGPAGAADVPAIRVPGSTGPALVVGDPSRSAFLALLPDGSLRCTSRSTERFVRDLASGGSGD